jgi:Secretion system C-terminal sorting domain
LIGQTTYDLQSNRATANRMAITGNALSAVWTQSCNLGSGPNFNNRGIGYNFAADASVATPGVSFLNGTTGTCGSGFGNFGIATVRTGWPEVAHVNGNEVVVAHTGSGLVKTTRPAGSGAWTTPSQSLAFAQNIDGPGSGANGTWPRMVASGNTIHLIYTSSITNNTTAPQNPVAQPGNVTQISQIVGPVVYSRSQDGGATWDKTNFLPPMFTRMDIGNGSGTDTVSIGGDSYALAANGNNVAITAGSFGDNTMVSKSTDNGSTWTTTRIDGHFTDADTIGVNTTGGRETTVLASDGALALVIDDAGAVHWFSGSQLLLVKPSTVRPGEWIPTGTYFPDAARALLYWNDRELRFSKPVIIAELDTICPSTAAFTPCDLSSPPDGGQSRQPYNVTGPISMPTAITDANGDVYVIYAAGRIGTSNDGTADGQYLRDLYLQRLSFPGGSDVQVYQQKNISRDIENIQDGAAALNGEESAYPSAYHKVVNNKIHYQWMSDFEPGNALQPTATPDPEVENAVMYAQITLPQPFTPDFTISGPLSVRNERTENVLSASVAPNPTTGKTTLTLNLKQDARATITVRNVLGQEVLRLPANALHTGLNTVNLDLSAQGAGVYFYTVSSDKFTLTQRVVKN